MMVDNLRQLIDLELLILGGMGIVDFADKAGGTVE